MTPEITKLRELYEKALLDDVSPADYESFSEWNINDSDFNGEPLKFSVVYYDKDEVVGREFKHATAKYIAALHNAFPSILRQLEAAEKMVEAVRGMGMKDLEESGGAMDDMRYGGNRMNEAWRNQRDAILKSFEEETV